MKVILLHNVTKIGKQGEIVEVADGYANGFLLPKRLAKSATPEAIKQLESQKKQKNASSEATKKEDKKLFDQINGIQARLKVQTNDKGVLFAGITAKDLVAALQNKTGMIIDPDMLRLDEQIKQVGLYQIPIAVGGNTGMCTLEVVKK